MASTMTHDEWREWDTARANFHQTYTSLTDDEWDTLEAYALQNAGDASESDTLTVAIETLRQYLEGELDNPMSVDL